MFSRRVAGIVVFMAFGLTACGADQVSRADTVGALTDIAVPTRWSELATSAATMYDATEAWCSTGIADELTTDIAAVRADWSRLAPFWFGPVMDRRSTVIIDPFVRGDDIDELLSGTEPVDAAALRDLYGADQRGLHAIEHIVELGSEATPDDRQCQYAVASAALVVEETEALADAWATAGPTMAVDEASANDALGDLVNEVLFTLAALDEDDPAVADAKLEGVRWALIGAGDTEMNDVGISALLDGDVVEQLTTELDAAADTLDEATRMNLERTITTNIVSALGLSVQFSDADGDG